MKHVTSETRTLHSTCSGRLLFIIGAGMSRAQVQLTLQPGVQLSWLENTNDTYHLQWNSNLTTTWIDLMAAAGNGLTNTYFDPFLIDARNYQLLDIVPAIPASSSLPSNGGFESGTGSSATGWTVDTAAGGLVYAVRTNDNPNSGSFNFEVYLASAGSGPVVQFNQSGIPVTGGQPTHSLSMQKLWRAARDRARSGEFYGMPAGIRGIKHLI